MAKTPAPAKKPRKKFGDNAKDFDARAAVENRTFELVMITPIAEGVVERRLRIRVVKGGLEDNVYEVGDQQCYCGLISEPESYGAKGANKWGGYSWGHIPVSILTSDYTYGYAREIFPELERPAKKDPKDAEAKAE